VGTKKPAREERAGKAPADYVWTKPDASVTLGHQCLCYYMPLLNDTQIYELHRTNVQINKNKHEISEFQENYANSQSLTPIFEFIG
jgi:predicted aconitase with swiveling domain